MQNLAWRTPQRAVIAAVSWPFSLVSTQSHCLSKTWILPRHWSADVCWQNSLLAHVTAYYYYFLHRNVHTIGDVSHVNRRFATTETLLASCAVLIFSWLECPASISPCLARRHTCGSTCVGCTRVDTAPCVEEHGTCRRSSSRHIVPTEYPVPKPRLLAKRQKKHYLSIYLFIHSSCSGVKPISRI